MRMGKGPGRELVQHPVAGLQAADLRHARAIIWPVPHDRQPPFAYGLPRGDRFGRFAGQKKAKIDPEQIFFKKKLERVHIFQVKKC